jgi:hypothetical protein
MHCFDKGYILNDKGIKSYVKFHSMYKLQIILAKVYSNPYYIDGEKDINILRNAILQNHKNLKDFHEKNENLISENLSTTENKKDSVIKKSSKYYSDNTGSVNSSSGFKKSSRFNIDCKISEQDIISNSK